MTRFAGLLLVLLSLFVSACSSLTEEEMAQLSFIAEEALVEVADEGPNDDQSELFQAKQGQTAGSGVGQATPPAGQTRRSVAAAVAAKMPVASPQGADASVWQARTLVDALNLDPTDHSACFRVLGRSFFNRCDQVVDAQTCDGQRCLTYRVPVGADLTIPHDYASLTPTFVAEAKPSQPQGQPQGQTQGQPQGRKNTSAKAQAQQNQAKSGAKSKAKAPSAQVQQAVKPTAQSNQVAKADADQAPAAGAAANTPEAQAILPGVPEGIQPEPAGSNLASTEFFSQGGFPLSF